MTDKTGPFQNRKFRKIAWMPFFLSVSLFVILLALSLSLWHMLETHEKNQLQELAGVQADFLGDDSADSLDKMAEALTRMTQRWIDSGGTPETAWNNDAESYIKNYPGLVSLSWADSNLIRRRAVSSREEKNIIGLDLKTSSLGYLFIRARDTRLPQASSVRDFKFVQGRGLLYAIPVYTGDRFDGVLIARFDTTDFFENRLKKDFLDKFWIAVKEGDNDVYSSFPDKKTQEGELTVKNSFDALLHKWDVTVTPRPEFLGTKRTILPPAVLSAGLLLSILSALSLYLSLQWQENARQLSYQRKILEVAFLSDKELQRTQDRRQKKSALLSDAANNTGAKFGILSCILIFMTMLSFTIYNAYTGVKTDIEFTERERAGNAIQKSLLSLLSNTVLLRADFMLQSSGTKLDEEIKNYISNINLEIKELRASTADAEIYGRIFETWDGIRQSPVLPQDEAIADFISEIKQAMTRLGNAYNLILDPRIDSYYLSESILSVLPDSLLRLSEAGAFVYPRLTGGRPATDDDRLIFASHAYAIEKYDMDRIETIFTTPALSGRKNSTSQMIAVYLEQNRHFSDILDRLSKKNPVDHSEFLTAFLVSAKTDYALAETLTGDLDAILDRRIAFYRGKENNILGAGLLLSLLAALSFCTGLRWRRNAGQFRDQSLFLELALSASQSGFWERDFETNAFWMSPRMKEIFGYADAELSSTPESLDKVIYTEDLARARKLRDEIREGLRKEEDYNHISRFHHKDGHTGYILSRVRCERDETGKALRMIGCITDITELESARKAANDANIAKREFLANMSHEIRTPMNGVIGMINLLLRTNLDIRQTHYATIVANSAESLLKILNDILDISKIEAGKLELENAPFSLKQICDDIAAFAVVQARQKNIDFSLTFPAAMPKWFTGDSLRIRQVLFNLCTNALKFTDRGSVALVVESLSSDAETASVKITVHDTGIGISEKERERIFRKFQQADTSTTRKYGGTGLGLAISQQLVALMGGCMDVSSVPEKGSAFFFTLPLALAHNPPLADAGATEDGAVAYSFKNITALLVDDSPVNQEVVSAMLGNLGIETAAAFNGPQALDLLHERDFDLIFMDCQMPDMDGFAITQRIRAGTRNATTKIVAMTANVMKGDRENCLAAGMDDYLGKPIRDADLRHVLLRWLAPEAAAHAAPGGAEKDVLSLDHAVLSELRLAVRDNFSSILVKLIDDADQLIADIEQGLARTDRKAIVNGAHRLKATSGQLGALRLYGHVVAIEKAGEKAGTGGDYGRIETLLATAKDEFVRVKDELKTIA